MVDLCGAAEFQEPSVTGTVVTLCGPHPWRISKATPANAPLLFFWMPLPSSWLSSPSIGHGMVPSQTFLDWVAWVGSSSSSMLTLDDITGNAY